ncbi:MAG: class I SAM-dependent methyltransferase [Planctomycetota bacterium]
MKRFQEELENASCPLCGRMGRRKMTLGDSLNRSSPERFHLVVCDQCDLGYVSNPPPPNGMDVYYPADYFAHQFCEDPFDRSVRSDLLSWLASKGARSRSRFVRDQVSLMETHGPMRSFRVLDAGCGTGMALKVMRDQWGAETVGIDFSGAAVSRGKSFYGLDLREGDPLSFDFSPAPFDVVTLWHFLEHVHSPKTVLEWVHGQLTKDGVVVIQVPNAQSFENRLWGARSLLYDSPRHLFHFSESALRKLLSASGFKVLSVEHAMMSGGWVLSLFYNLFGEKAMKSLKKSAFHLFACAVLAAPLDLMSCLLNRGSILTMVAKRA